MEKTYKHLSLFFVGILLVLLWGFYRTYFSLVPDFKGITNTMHFHGILMLTWLAMLIVQPVLIRKKKLELHRMIGKLSYLVMPLLLISIFMVGKSQYIKMNGVVPPPVLNSTIALNVPSLLSFAAFYTLALVYKRPAAFHMRYMIATSLLLIGPGLGRALIIYFGMDFELAVSVTNWLAILIAVALLLVDLKNKKSYVPYTVIIVILVWANLTWEFKYSGIVQSFCSWFGSVFY